MKVRFAVGIGVLALSAVVALWGAGSAGAQTPQPTVGATLSPAAGTTVTPTVPVSSSVVVSGTWVTFTDSAAAFTLTYASGWSVKDQKPGVVMFAAGGGRQIEVAVTDRMGFSDDDILALFARAAKESQQTPGASVEVTGSGIWTGHEPAKFIRAKMAHADGSQGEVMAVLSSRGAQSIVLINAGVFSGTLTAQDEIDVAQLLASVTLAAPPTPEATAPAAGK
jgi:hypothetical protein